MSSKNASNENTIAAFMKARTEALELASDIVAHLEDHMNATADSVNWANVGDAQYAAAKLRELSEFLGLSKDAS